METGLVGVVGSCMLAGVAAGQTLDVVVSQPPATGVGSQASEHVTGAQTIEPARELVDDFIAPHDAVAHRIRLYAEPSSNVYAIRLRLIELDQQGNEIAEIAETTAGVRRVGAGTAKGLDVFDVDLDGPVGLRDGTRYGIEAVGLLVSPTLGDIDRSWRWVGAAGDGSMLERTDSGLVRLDHPGAAFEVLGEILAPVCLADVNEDGALTPADFSAWVAAFNARDPKADQNGDGQILPDDFTAWVSNYNAGC